MRTPRSAALNGGAHERLTDREVKARLKGLPGASGTMAEMAEINFFFWTTMSTKNTDLKIVDPLDEEK